MEMNARTTLKYSFAALLIVLGLAFNYFALGTKAFLGFGSLGNYLLYIGFVALIIVTIQAFWTRHRIVDERMLHVANKANRIAFLSLFILAFAIIIADGIRPISMPYHLFMAYFVCAILVVYMAAYRILLHYS
jgi:uncharacterized membrane protein